MEEPIRKSKAIDSISKITDLQARHQAILTAASFGDKMDENEIDFSTFSKIEENTLMDLSEFKDITGGLFSGKRDKIKNVDAALEQYLSVRNSTNIKEKLDKFKTLYEVTKEYNGNRNKNMLKFFVQLSMEKYKIKKEIFNECTNQIDNQCNSTSDNDSKLNNIKSTLENFDNDYFSYNNIFPSIKEDFKTYISVLNLPNVSDKIHSIMIDLLKVSYKNTEINKYKHYINFFNSYKLIFKDLKTIIDGRTPLENILHLTSKDIKKITDEIKDIFDNREEDLKNYILSNKSIKDTIHNIIKEKLDEVHIPDEFDKCKQLITTFNGFGFNYNDLQSITYNETILNNILEINPTSANNAEIVNMKKDLRNVNLSLLSGILQTGVRIRYTTGSSADELGDNFGNQQVRGHGGATWKSEKTPGVFAPKATLENSLTDNTSNISTSSRKAGKMATKATNGLVLAQIGQDEDTATKMHGSYNMQLHELGHGIDYTFLQSDKLDDINNLFKTNLSAFTGFNTKSPIFWQNRKITDSQLFKHIQKQELNAIFHPDIYGNYYYNNIEEYFAETFSMFNSTRKMNRNTSYIKFAYLKNGSYDPNRYQEADTYIDQLPKEALKNKAPMTYEFFKLLSQLR